MTVQAKIKYREHAIERVSKTSQEWYLYKTKSIEPYPEMQSSETQAAVNAACDQVQCVILDQVL